ncbi:hypothetical protein KSS87_007586 [Heliosperma pusillum]|nr:hypothetical protein KSS87_007586 [Heliosperma pusillum]
MLVLRSLPLSRHLCLLASPKPFPFNHPPRFLNPIFIIHKHYPINFIPNSISFSCSSAPALNPQLSPTESQDFDVGPYLSCSMPGRNLKVAVLVSGGVDSSVALRLLHAAECPWEEDLAYVKAVCNQVDVPLEVVHLTDEYWDKVVSYIIEEYRNGRTPNPDVLCNTRIKFGAFMDAISNMGFDYVASGHYANVVHLVTDDSDQPSILKLSRDAVKDQTYFLSHLDQSQLKRLMFPLGHIPKNEVRKLAMQFDLPNKGRKDSQGICFLGKIKFSDFVARQIGEMEGVILEAETGDFLGKHRGFWFYTIGQRQGLRLPGGPWYVVEKDTKNNVVFVSRSYYSIDKRRRVFRVGSLKWLNGKPLEKLSDLQCKVRHGPNLYSCSLMIESCENSHGDIAVVYLSEDDQGLAAGQFAAFYQGNTCIGSGIILESWDDQGFPVCGKALEIARLPDKSKLGKPVKITVKPEDSQAYSYQKVEHTNSSTETDKTEVPILSLSPSLNWMQRLKHRLLKLF